MRVKLAFLFLLFFFAGCRSSDKPDKPQVEGFSDWRTFYVHCSLPLIDNDQEDSRSEVLSQCRIRAREKLLAHRLLTELRKQHPDYSAAASRASDLSVEYAGREPELESFLPGQIKREVNTVDTTEIYYMVSGNRLKHRVEVMPITEELTGELKKVARDADTFKW